jgi:hypothetical protein
LDDHAIIFIFLKRHLCGNEHKTPESIPDVKVALTCDDDAKEAGHGQRLSQCRLIWIKQERWPRFRCLRQKKLAAASFFIK